MLGLLQLPVNWRLLLAPQPSDTPAKNEPRDDETAPTLTSNKAPVTGGAGSSPSGSDLIEKRSGP